MNSQSGQHEQRDLVLAVSDQSQLLPLRDWLDGQPGVEATLTPGLPGEGEQGSFDVVTVLAGSSGVVAAIKVLPAFIRSRRSDFHIRTVVKGQKFVLDASNVEDLMPVLERLLDE